MRKLGEIKKILILFTNVSLLILFLTYQTCPSSLWLGRQPIGLRTWWHRPGAHQLSFIGPTPLCIKTAESTCYPIYNSVCLLYHVKQTAEIRLILNSATSATYCFSHHHQQRSFIWCFRKHMPITHLLVLHMVSVVLQFCDYV